MKTVRSVPLAESADVIRGVTFSKADSVAEPRDGYVPVLRAGNIQSRLILEDGLIFVPSTKVSEKQKLRRGDIVMCTSSGSSEIVGKTAYSYEDWEGSFGAFCAVVRPKEGRIHSRYLFHYLQSPRFRDWTRNSSGVGIKNIRKSELDSVEVPLPGIGEQRRIATILDKAETISRKREQALELADDFLKSAFAEMFGNGDWPTQQLAKVVSEGTIVTYGIVQAGPEYKGGVPYIRTGDIKNGKILLENLGHTSPEIAAKFARSTVRAGEIVMSIRATVGTTALVPEELDGANLTQGTARISPGDMVTTEYLLHFLRSQPCQDWISGQIKGATFREITLTRLREMEVPIPPLEAQQKFSRLTEAASILANKCASDLSQAENLFGSLSQRAFKGEL